MKILHVKEVGIYNEKKKNIGLFLLSAKNKTILSKNRENVVLMHDVKRNTAYALEEILQFGVANGYRFEPITMYTKEVHHGINN